MTVFEKWSLIISGGGLVIIMLGLIVRITLRWGKIENHLESIADKVGSLVAEKEDAHKELRHGIEKVDSRIERHEAWHDDHPYVREHYERSHAD
jgi:hypothetical protein